MNKLASSLLQQTRRHKIWNAAGFIRKGTAVYSRPHLHERRKRKDMSPQRSDGTQPDRLTSNLDTTPRVDTRRKAIRHDNPRIMWTEWKTAVSLSSSRYFVSSVSQGFDYNVSSSPAHFRFLQGCSVGMFLTLQNFTGTCGTQVYSHETPLTIRIFFFLAA